MMTLKNLIVCVVLMSLTPIAMAVQPEGLYTAEDIGRSTFKNACQAMKTPYTSCKDNDFSHRFSLGYKFSELNAFEIGYYSSGQTTEQGTGNISATMDSVEWQFSGLRYSIVNIGGDTGRLLVFGKLGVVHWESAITKTIYSFSSSNHPSGNAILLGVGAKYYITQDTSIRVQYELHRVGNAQTGWNGDVNFLSAGLSYHF
jgi:OmpA-like transmembrane domain